MGDRLCTPIPPLPYTRVRGELYMRPTCLLCALKHLGDALVLWTELTRGYEQEHIALFVGSLSQAEQESTDYQEISELIEQERRAFLDSLPGWRTVEDLYTPDLLPIVGLCLDRIRQSSRPAVDSSPDPE